ncbi:MAG: hypothetical protein B6D64_11235 [Bacteroidetes bacterium 4484_276]|nr:MAG: hypothetical protein B6D64_11235 [Bacteroidetes bacterium 4484_276]OYT12728.1 MAG: hypothetical protein B6I19_08840 [Bacteroidetes bacterium 4572_114]
MKTILNVEVNPDILLTFNQKPKEFGNELRLWAAVSMYWFDKISLARAATLAGYHRYDFEKFLATLDIPTSKLTDEDAEKEINMLKSL